MFRILLMFLLSVSAVFAQDSYVAERIDKTVAKPANIVVNPATRPILSKYYAPQDGVSLRELIDKALQSNQELVAARFEIDKAKARLQQARLRPNPTLDLEQTTEAFFGSPGDRSLSVGVSLPIEIYGRRSSRIDLAKIEIEASEADVRNRERVLVANILTSYAEALGALRELEVTERLLDLDLETARIVQIRVNEGESAPLELNLLQAEVERLRARRQLIEGKLQASYIQLKLLASIPFEDTFRLGEQMTSASLPALPVTTEAAIDIAMRTRPDVRLAQIEEQAAFAGLKLIRAESHPSLTANTRYSQDRATYDTAPVPFIDRGRSLTFGVSVGLPVFNKNQGAKAEAELAIRQAKARRDFGERVVRSEIIAAFQRYEAASRAVATLETSALPRTTENVETFRKIYELGQIQITDLITEQRRLLDTTRDLTEALAERYRAQADINIAIGAGALLPQPK